MTSVARRDGTDDWPTTGCRTRSCGVFAEFGRAMIPERLRADLERAKAQGQTLGRPLTRPRLSKSVSIRAARRQGKGINKIATELGIGVRTVQRVVHRPVPNPGP